MSLIYQKNGNLAEGIHQITWEEFVREYGFTVHRMKLIEGLRMATLHLFTCGCPEIFVDGSFVTKKTVPNDYDACWSHHGVDLLKLKQEFPLFFDFENGRYNQKKYYKGELFPAQVPAAIDPVVMYLEFFQRDRENKRKGIISLLLKNIHYDQ